MYGRTYYPGLGRGGATTIRRRPIGASIPGRGAGLGRTDWSQIRRLPPTLQRIVVDELDNPESIEGIKGLLRSPNPAQAIAAEISSEVAQAMREPILIGTGVGDLDGGLGKFKFKKIIKKVKAVHKKVAAKIVPKAIRKIHAKIQKVGKKVWKKYGNVIITVAGAVLAPFTGGASLIAASVLTAANTMYQKKRQADVMKKTAKKEAAAVAAEYKQQEAQVNAEADKLFKDNQPVFAAAGITPEKWARLTIDQKIAVIEKINKGEMPAIPSAIDEAKKEGELPATAQATGTPSIPNQPSFGYVAPAVSSWEGAGVQAPAYPAASGQRPYAKPYPDAPGYAGPSTEGEPPADVVPTIEGQFEVFVEGRKVGQATDSEEMSRLVTAKSSPGDRIEVLVDGKSSGLKIRTEAGVMNVPPEHEVQVRKMTKDQVKALVARATAAAEKSGAKPGAGFPWWIVLAGGAAAAAAAAA